MLSLLGVVLFAVPLAAAPQDFASEAKAVQAFKKAIRTSPKQHRTAEQRLEALVAIEGYDSPKVVEALVKAHAEIEEEILVISAERAEFLAEMAKLRRGQEFSQKPTYPRPVLERIKDVKKELDSRRKKIDELRGLYSAVRERISATRDKPAVQWLVKNVLGSKKHSLLLKLTVSKLAGELSEDVITDLERVFAKARKPAQIVALLEGITYAGVNAKSIAPKIIKLLDHKEVAVREKAALALAKIAVPEAIEPMIDLLEREEGRTQNTIAAALEMLTQQKHGVLVDSWRRWYADEKEKLLAGDAPLGGGMFERRSSTKDMGYYFDIAMDGKSIMYIIDSSGSMTAEIELVIKESDGTPKKQSRLEACKAELIGALGRLEEEAEFNIIWYNDLPYLFSEEMLPANKQKIGAGQDWVRKLVANSTTNIYDSLKMAFEVAGQGSKDKYYSVGLDTIFLLTDGSPTTSDNKADSTEKIIEAVREWNALKRITIHCIGIGKNINTAFLQQLAKENNGEFRQY